MEFLVEATKINQHSNVVELGAGTGIFTRDLVAAVPGVQIVAVEPTPMGQHIGELPVAQAVPESAEHMPYVPSGKANAVFAAQSFHWFASPQSLKEIHRVLCPAGHFGVVWSTTQAVEEFVAPHYSESVPRQQSGLWRRAFDSAPGLFAAAATHKHSWVHLVNASRFVNRAMSVSVIAALDAAPKRGVQQSIEQHLQKHLHWTLTAANGGARAADLSRDEEKGHTSLKGCVAVLCDEGSATANHVGGLQAVQTQDGRKFKVVYSIAYETDAFVFAKQT